MTNSRIENITVQFVDKISLSQYDIILQQLNKEYYRLQEYLLKHGLWKQRELDDVRVVVKSPLFGQYAAMRKNKEITLFGVQQYGFFIHELVHILYPTKYYRFHEGFADYVQSVLATDLHIWGGMPLRQVANIHLFNRYSVKQENYHLFILCPDNFNDPRLNRCFFTRSLASGFVAHLIDQLGIQEYMDRYHLVGLPSDNIKLNLDMISQVEKQSFEQFLDNIEPGEVDVEAYNSYYTRKHELFEQWKEFFQYNVPSRGHPLKHWDQIPSSYQKDIMNLYMQEIAMDKQPLRPELWKLI